MLRKNNHYIDLDIDLGQMDVFCGLKASLFGWLEAPDFV